MRLIWFGIFLLVACRPAPSTPAASSTVQPSPPALAAATSSPPPTAVPSTTPAASPSHQPSSNPTPSEVVIATELPGYDGWQIVNPAAVEATLDDGALVLALKRRALWFDAERGVLFYQLVTGNFKISALVDVSRKSDAAKSLGGRGSVQLAGLMARSGSGAENYVFIVVGNDGDGLSVETKTTVNSVSAYHGPSWGSASAELRVCRFGAAFSLYKRHAGEASWILADTYQRPDLPDTLQVGANIYTDSDPDLRATYSNLQIEPISAESDCAADGGWG
jgi:hypothetical protein